MEAGVSGHRVPALATLPSSPVLEADVRRFRVVVPQHGADQHEEIADPAGFQRVPNRHAGIARAKSFIVDVRVRDVVVPCGGIGVRSDDGVGRVRGFPKPADLQLDLKGAQIDAVQFDGFGRDP